MKLAIMQPYFLPYLGYYSLIKYSDLWIFNDEVQMIKKGWIERNRILKQYGGWQYIRVPLAKHHHDTLIKDIRIRTEEYWGKKILAQLGHFRKKAPYYHKVNAFLEDAFEQNLDTITDLNAHLLKKTCEYIGLDFEFEILSKMNLEIGEVHEPDDWSLNICKSLGADHYVNSILGKQFYNTQKYDKANIKIDFLNWLPTPYVQNNGEWIEGLSIVNAMMFNAPEEINLMLDNYNLE